MKCHWRSFWWFLYKNVSKSKYYSPYYLKTYFKIASRQVYWQGWTHNIPLPNCPNLSMLFSVPGLCHNASFIFPVERKRRSHFFGYGVFVVLFGFFFSPSIYSFWNYVERMQLADVSQRPGPMWLCSETTAQCQELSVLLDESKSQTQDHCLVIVREAESSWSELHCVTANTSLRPLNSVSLKGGISLSDQAGRRRKETLLGGNWGTELFCSRPLRNPIKNPGWASP